MKMLLYCTKTKPFLWKQIKGVFSEDLDWFYKVTNDEPKGFLAPTVLNGKIVAECDFEIEQIKSYPYDHTISGTISSDTEVLSKAKLTIEQLEDYLKPEYKYDTCGYAIHISNLNIFDKPKDLNDYKTSGDCPFNCELEEYWDLDCGRNFRYVCTKKAFCRYYNHDYECCDVESKKITKAPQNMMYCRDENYNKNILISIRPEWLCMILNREKTIEVRKKVLKEMLKDTKLKGFNN